MLQLDLFYSEEQLNLLKLSESLKKLASVLENKAYYNDICLEQRIESTTVKQEIIKKLSSVAL